MKRTDKMLAYSVAQPHLFAHLKINAHYFETLRLKTLELIK